MELDIACECDRECLFYMRDLILCIVVLEIIMHLQLGFLVRLCLGIVILDKFGEI